VIKQSNRSVCGTVRAAGGLCSLLAGWSGVGLSILLSGALFWAERARQQRTAVTITTTGRRRPLERMSESQPLLARRGGATSPGNRRSLVVPSVSFVLPAPGNFRRPTAPRNEMTHVTKPYCCSNRHSLCYLLPDCYSKAYLPLAASREKGTCYFNRR
jgi:hypothetical protein